MVKLNAKKGLLKPIKPHSQNATEPVPRFDVLSEMGFPPSESLRQSIHSQIHAVPGMLKTQAISAVTEAGTEAFGEALPVYVEGARLAMDSTETIFAPTHNIQTG